MRQYDVRKVGRVSQGVREVPKVSKGEILQQSLSKPRMVRRTSILVRCFWLWADWNLMLGAIPVQKTVLAKAKLGRPEETMEPKRKTSLRLGRSQRTFWRVSERHT